MVGIGASAGGLEAFRAFLSAAPIDSGLAFVLVQHLAPDHRSILAELLQSVTAMPVHEIEGDVAVEPNHVYVILQNTSLTITDGTLRLAEPAQLAGHRAPIDGFFMSLAEDQGENAACVILSGGGYDGTQGLRAIKEHGGLVLAQSAETAAHDSMLRSAVQTGLVDFQLPVEAMPAKLRHYFRHVDGVRDKKGADGLRAATPQDLRRICEHLRARTGHDFSGYKESTLVRRIQRRMQVLQIDELSRYTEHLRKHGQEADLLFKDLLISPKGKLNEDRLGVDDASRARAHAGADRRQRSKNSPTTLAHRPGPQQCADPDRDDGSGGSVSPPRLLNIWA